MSLVIITGNRPEHHYVANEILAAHDVLAIFVCDPPKRRSWYSLLRSSPIKFTDKLLRKLFLQAIRDQKSRKTSLSRVLGSKSYAFDRNDIVINVGTPKGGALEQHVRNLNPDIIAVYGTGIIPDSVLNLARVVSLNMHTGLSPWYRGTACTFWPIVEARPEMIGATVHECTSKVDGGSIFFRRRAALYKGDDLHTIFARAVMVGAEGYVEVIKRALNGDIHGETQDLNIGKEYRGSMLGIKAELAARRSLKRLAAEWPDIGSNTDLQKK